MAQIVELQAGLQARADDGDAIYFSRSEILGRNSARSSRTAIREISLVLEYCQQFARVLAEQQNHAVARWQTALRVLPEAAGDLDGERSPLRKIAVLDVTIARGILEVQLTHRRDDGLAPRKRAECLLHRGNDLNGIDNALYFAS